MWQLPTTLEAVVLSVALARIGAVQVPVIAVLREAELRTLIPQVKPDVVVTTTSWRGFDHAKALGLLAGPSVPVVVSDHLTAGPGLALPRLSTGGIPEPARPSSPGWIYTTSGTTGALKCVLHNDATVIATSNATVAVPVDANDRFAVAFPFAHIGGLSWLATALRTGCQLVLFDAFDPALSPQRMAAHQVTLLGSATPFFLAYLAAQRAHGDTPLFDHLRACMGGGAATPTHLDETVRRELGGRGIANGYGLTECPVVGFPDLDDDEARRDSMWRPGPGVRARIVAPDGTECPPGEVGELRLTGPQRFLGYLDPAMDAEVIDEMGFVRTGDLARMDGRGRITITGRLKEIIIRNGENISMAEVEGVLAGHPDVADAAVIGLPDERRGELCCAAIVPRPGARVTPDDLAQFCRSAGLASFKIPERVTVVAEVPRNAMGKIRRDDVRALLSGSERES